MPQNDNQVTDPVLLAAMIEDPDETPEEKAQREALMKEAGAEEVPSQVGGSSNDDEEDEDPKDKEDIEEDPNDKPEPKKPAEAGDDEVEEDDEDDPKDPKSNEDSEEDDDKKKSRKERRQERNQDYLQSIRKDNYNDSNSPNIPNYDPIDYSKENEEGFKPEELQKDREMVGAVSFARGAVEAREAAKQDQFWNELASEAKILAYDPELNFLSDKLPNGKDNPNFDADKAAYFNGKYLQLAGFQQFYQTDQQGRPLYNPQTGQPLVVNRVRRTDLSYDKFVRTELEFMKEYAEDFADTKVDEATKNLKQTRKNQGVRPGGGKRKSLGAINPGDISSMSDEDFAKNEEAIDAQINNMLGL